MTIIETIKSRFGRIIYGMLSVGVLVYTLYRFSPGHETTDDFVYFGMLFMMGFLAFPISIIAIPLVFILSMGITIALHLFISLFVESPNGNPIASYLIVFLTWVGIFLSGYLQWFWFPKYFDRKHSTITIKN